MHARPEVLEQIRMRALPAVEEMARWKTLEHALPAYILLGRIAGIPEQQLKDDWAEGNRDAMIAQAAEDCFAQIARSAGR